jgi:uncharacterized protein (DUF983 family)
MRRIGEGGTTMEANEQMMRYQVTGFPALLIFLVIGFLCYGWPAMKIARRTGKPVWAALLMGVPLVNIIVIWIFATSEWNTKSKAGTFE